MVKKMKEISPGRYRESFGRYYEEFVVGDVYEHRPGRTITQSDNIWFTLLTMNQHPLHIDDEYGKGTEFGQTLVVSPFTIARNSKRTDNQSLSKFCSFTIFIIDMKRVLIHCK